MEYITHGTNLLLALIVKRGEFPKGMQFWGYDRCPLQFGSCVYDKGKVLLPHIHKVRERPSPHKTIEFLYIIKGKVEANFYTLDKILVETRVLVGGDCVLLYDGGHGFKVLEDGTKFIEVKSGPFVSVEDDKVKFEP